MNARFVVDATGQDALFGRHGKTLSPWEGFGRAAVFCHFEGVSGEAADALYQTGNIKVLVVEDGWMWLIPLQGRKLSVGLVTRRQGVKPEWLEEAIAASPVTLALTAGAPRTAPRIIRNFSFKNDRPWGARHACIGDAAAFLDPVFSSGVSLAMLSGEYLADRLAPALAENREGDPRLMSALADHMDVAYRSFGGLVHSFYHLRLVHSLFFGEQKESEIKRGVISVLAGDVWREDNRFREMLLGSARHAGPFAKRPATP